MTDKELELVLGALFDAQTDDDSMEKWDRNKKAITAIKQARSAPVQDLPFGVGGGLVAIKTLLSRDPCVHANTAIEMIDAILKEHPAAQRPWVGLTEQERNDIEDYCEMMIGKPAFEAIEAKLKEKNT